jgi:hypothetical protein
MITETPKQSVSTAENRMIIPLVDRNVKNTRNIPAMIFIENVDDYLEKYNYELLMEEINVYYR